MPCYKGNIKDTAATTSSIFPGVWIHPIVGNMAQPMGDLGIRNLGCFRKCPEGRIN